MWQNTDFSDPGIFIEREKELLDGFLNLAGSQTAGTHSDSFNGSFFHDLDALKVGIEFPGADVMGV